MNSSHYFYEPITKRYYYVGKNPQSIQIPHHKYDSITGKFIPILQETKPTITNNNTSSSHNNNNSNNISHTLFARHIHHNNYQQTLLYDLYLQHTFNSCKFEIVDPFDVPTITGGTKMIYLSDISTSFHFERDQYVITKFALDRIKSNYYLQTNDKNYIVNSFVANFGVSVSHDVIARSPPQGNILVVFGRTLVDYTPFVCGIDVNTGEQRIRSHDLVNLPRSNTTITCSSWSDINALSNNKQVSPYLTILTQKNGRGVVYDCEFNQTSFVDRFPSDALSCTSLLHITVAGLRNGTMYWWDTRTSQKEREEFGGNNSSVNNNVSKSQEQQQQQLRKQPKIQQQQQPAGGPIQMVEFIDENTLFVFAPNQSQASVRLFDIRYPSHARLTMDDFHCVQSSPNPVIMYDKVNSNFFILGESLKHPSCISIFNSQGKFITHLPEIHSRETYTVVPGTTKTTAFDWGIFTCYSDNNYRWLLYG
jgi:hypothetical protein